MDFSKFTYAKGEPKQDAEYAVPGENLPLHKSEEGGEEAKSTTDVSVSPNYQKPEGTLSPILVFVLSGGETRERNILKVLIQQKELHSLRVLFLSEQKQGLQPYQMQEKWQYIRQKKQLEIDGQIYNLYDIDKVFLLSDVDEFYEQLSEILSVKAAEDGGCWVISNPCIEIWLYFCYKNEPKTDLACIEALPESERSKRLKSLGNEIIKGGFNFNYAFEHLHEGIENSVKYYEEDEKGIPVIFATGMYKLAKFIVETLETNGNEYKKYINRKRLERERYCRKG